MRALNLILALALVSTVLPAAEKYTGPRPPKADVPYLVHADNLIETEVGTATNETRKDKGYAVIEGASSPVKTPLAEPIFIFKSDKIAVDKIEAYKLEPVKGRREVLIQSRKPKDIQRPIYLKVTRLDDRLYRIEVDEPLENGEYSLTPQGSDATFSFAIY